MTSDMVVALTRATNDGCALFGHNLNAKPGQSLGLIRTPAHDYATGECVRTTHLTVPQARHTHTVLAGRCGAGWGYDHGVNVHGVAVGWTAIRTRLESDTPALTGADLVRLALERGATASQAVEVLTDLIGRYGQGSCGNPGRDSALLVADAREAFILEAAGRHWVVGHVGSVKALSGVCLLRQDWDRISRGLADLAITCGWMPQDGCKLDFAATLGLRTADHTGAFRRWGLATLALEQHTGKIDDIFLRRLLSEHASMLHPADADTVGSFVARLGQPDELPLAWVAFIPSVPLFLPVLAVGSLPECLSPAPAGCRFARVLTRWAARTSEDMVRREAAEIQRGLDVRVAEFLPEARALASRGRDAALELSQLASSFMQHCTEQVEQWLSGSNKDEKPQDAEVNEEVFVG